MIIWLNGAFGAGKTTTARELTHQLAKSRIFDSEQVGFMLRHVLSEPVEDFQDWPPWRSLVTHTAIEVLRYVEGTLVIPQTLLVQSYAQEIFQAFADAGITVRHYLLHVRQDELARRIEHDRVERRALGWRMDHLSQYRAALSWLRESAECLDTTHLSAQEVARDIATGLLGERTAG